MVTGPIILTKSIKLLVLIWLLLKKYISILLLKNTIANNLIAINRLVVVINSMIDGGN